MKRETIAVVSGNLTDVWSGGHNLDHVAIKMFHECSDASTAESKKVTN
jgi:hypothetical protein